MSLRDVAIRSMYGVTLKLSFVELRQSLGIDDIVTVVCLTCYGYVLRKDDYCIYIDILIS